MERDVTPPKGVRGGPATKSVGQFRRAQALERKNPKKGSAAGMLGGLPSDVPVSERTRRGINALETAPRRLCLPSGGEKTRGVTAGGLGLREEQRSRSRGNP